MELVRPQHLRRSLVAVVVVGHTPTGHIPPLRASPYLTSEPDHLRLILEHCLAPLLRPRYIFADAV